MILFGMLDYDVVDLLYAQSIQVFYEHIGHSRIHGIDERDLVLSPDQI